MTCVRGKEAACKLEIVRILDDYAKEFYSEKIKKHFEALDRGEITEDGEEHEDEEVEHLEEAQLDIEERIKREIEELKRNESTGFKTKEEKKRDLFEGMEIGCECGRYLSSIYMCSSLTAAVVFVRTRSPIDPIDLVTRVCRETKETGTKRSRYAQRLTPVKLTASAGTEALAKLCDQVLKKEFHSGQTCLKVS